MVNEADILKAIADLNLQEKPNYFQTAKKYNINRTTLMRRYKRQTHHKAHSIHLSIYLSIYLSLDIHFPTFNSTTATLHLLKPMLLDSP
jgi:hypothetical protein